MELKATAVGQHLAQHPYNRACLLHAGIEVSGNKHYSIIPFNQLIAVQYKRGIVWGELEFELPDGQVVRLHGTPLRATQQFYQLLMQRWQSWDQEMLPIAIDVLNLRVAALQQLAAEGSWLSRARLEQLLLEIRTTLQALPLPEQRLTEFSGSADGYALCQRWLQQSEQLRQQHNRCYLQTLLSQKKGFFVRPEHAPFHQPQLDQQQAEAIVCEERWVQVTGGVGSGKTELLAIKSKWLCLQQGGAQQILLLVSTLQAATSIRQRLDEDPVTKEVQVMTFAELAWQIVQQVKKTPIKISALEGDDSARYTWLIASWRQQCQEKTAQAKGWRQWLGEQLNWPLESEAFWQDPHLAERLAPRLDRWLRLMRMQGGPQSEIVALADEEERGPLQKQLRLLSPLLKAWKSELKAQGAIDSYRLTQQAVELLAKERFNLPWRALLVDDFQDLSFAQGDLLVGLGQLTDTISLFSVEDPQQSIGCFDDLAGRIASELQQVYGAPERLTLSSGYRCDPALTALAQRMLQFWLPVDKRGVKTLLKGRNRQVVLLAEDQLTALLDKLSGSIRPDERILLLARYRYLQPACLRQAATRWPALWLDFMSIEESIGQQAEWVIISGLENSIDGFPIAEGLTALERTLLPAAGRFPNGREQRLLYLALTRARQQVWLLYDPQSPSPFIHQLTDNGAVVKKRC